MSRIKLHVGPSSVADLFAVSSVFQLSESFGSAITVITISYNVSKGAKRGRWGGQRSFHVMGGKRRSRKLSAREAKRLVARVFAGQRLEFI